jgi:hypothetical protein
MNDALDLAPITLDPDTLEAMGSDRESIEAFAIADLCRGLERLAALVGGGTLNPAEAETQRQELLARNLSFWGRYSPANP